MRYQRDQYSCGAAAVVNAIRCFGKKVSEQSVRSFSSTTKEKGTDEHGIIAALRGLGFDGYAFEFDSVDRAQATEQLSAMLRRGEPAIICTQNFQHWVTVVGKLANDRYVIIDPSTSNENKRENGVNVLTKTSLIKTWQSRDGKLFGVGCKTK